jgi:hypothetical protein
MNLTRLLVIHAVVTLAAGIALIVSPNLIPATVGIKLDRSEYLMSYLLGASELGSAFLSFFAKGLENVKAVRLITWTFIIFHVTTAVVEVYALTQGAQVSLLFNVFVRIVVAALFAYYGLYQTRLGNDPLQ